jgi:hypothetical protein
MSESEDTRLSGSGGPSWSAGGQAVIWLWDPGLLSSADQPHATALLSGSVCTRCESRQASPNSSLPTGLDSPNEPMLTGSATRLHSVLSSFSAWPALSMFQWKIWWDLTERRNAAQIQPAR